MSTVRDVETEILAVFRDYIVSHSKRLGELGLAFEVSVTRSSEEAGYRSEAKAEFRDENGIWDVLEFEVARGDKFLLSVEDVKEWLPDAFSSVISRREAETGGRGGHIIQ